ncbi:receptor-type guanylate cyclase Gyc76C-like [Saccostrea echinata]|uniref:receptor-type guanylate cyclase Gyc76C-like n=1 Tax=Saccostrea echinata TaxID=191078 RepID=UPI002A83B5FB|nr:receptor-type guanylate cyclase Gyc76C-like [Saccostrea echinata]
MSMCNLNVFLFFACACVLCSPVSMSNVTKPLKISFLASRTFYGELLYGGAFYRAIDDINKDDSLLPGYVLEPIFADTHSDILQTVGYMTEHKINGTLGFIGPEGACGIAATNAASWNMPMVVYRCHDSELSGDPQLERRIRQTFVRTEPSTSKVSKSITSLLLHFNWRKISLVLGNRTVWNQTAENLKSLLRENDIEIRKEVLFQEPYFPSLDMSKYVHATVMSTRIYVFLGDYHALIDFVRSLDKQPKDNGDFAVITVLDEQPTSKLKHFLKTPFETELKDEHWMAFRNVLVISPRSPSNPEWDSFIDDVRMRNMEPPISLPRPPPSLNVTVQQVVPIQAAHLYDAVMVLARALDTVISNNGSSLKNGRDIVSNIQKASFKSIQGFDVYVDETGDAEGNYSLLSLTMPAEGRPFLGPVGCFNRYSSDLGVLEFILNKEIKWTMGQVPRDEPPCGFDEEKCQYEPDWKLATICSVIAAAVCVGMVFVCRHYLYEQKIARLLWKLEYKDLMFIDNVEEVISPAKRKKRSSEYFPSLFPKYYSYLMGLSRSDLIKRKSHTSWRFLIDGDESGRSTLLGTTKSDSGRSTFFGNKSDKKGSTRGSVATHPIKVGSYKGTMVSIKILTRKSLDMNQSLKKQLYIRKELTHDNINKFIGVCVESPHLYIVTQYCARGSLKDILKNEDIYLDDMFIASLVADLIKGMIFIHDSEIGFHGNLKSSTCLVDSRWVLQIADFGLQQLLSKETSIKGDTESHYDELLWTAPELLRSKNAHTYGTQKGDTYSFAIILYEIHGREGPWGNTKYTPSEIVNHVIRDAAEAPFRPDITRLSCEDFIKQCITECWHEAPDFRPDFKYIRVRLKPMQQGLKPNIFDNMLAIMEKYANNLEALVAERTEQLSEEKQMTENLLFRMLPRPIANKLKRGHYVNPESYDCVTMYFSDIVGFTALSAESTPMQVIDMLNELYTCFDSIIAHYDVYKVETIGDAYLVVSGLPIRNGDNHAGEIASMSLKLLSAILSFKIKHRPDDTLKLRIGIHSGPVVAGVVGLRMPRYTLFGDTVNTASRMETNGLPLKIHCSSQFKAILDKLGGYTLTERGFVSMKGKGDQFTYFLESEDESYRTKRLESMERASSFSTKPTLNIVGCRKCSGHVCDSYSLNNTYEKCSGYSDYCSDCLRNSMPKFVSEQNVECNTGSYEDDFRQNLENNNTRSHSDTCEFWRESEVQMPLMDSNGGLGFYGTEVLSDESVL